MLFSILFQNYCAEIRSFGALQYLNPCKESSITFIVGDDGGITVMEEPTFPDFFILDSNTADAGEHEERQSVATPPTPEPPPPVEREVSPARNPPSCAVHVFNLVRPFTQKQLVQHLSQFGAVAEGGFWMNKIKSHCYVIVSFKFQHSMT